MNPYKSSGGGTAYLSQMDVPAKTVMSHYAISRYDYYIGCQHSEPITINFPQTYNGRVIIVKDETGNADLLPITLLGNIDQETEVVIASKNASLTLVFNNSKWRIV